MVELLDIGIDNHFDLMILNQNDEYPINLDKRGNIHMEPINEKEGRLNMLNEMYELILEKYFSELPKNSILIYPAVGDDMIFCDFAKKYGHKAVCIDGHENIKIPKDILINKNFKDYKKLEKEIKEKGDIKEGDNVIFVFKGFDTLNEISQKEIDKIIDDFDGNQIALFGCKSNWVGLGIPRMEGQAFENLKDNGKFKDSTGEYFSENSKEIMKKVSDISEKLNWKTGFFPATDIKVFSRQD